MWTEHWDVVAFVEFVMIKYQENIISIFPNYKLKISAFTDGMLQREAFGLYFLSFIFYQTMIQKNQTSNAKKKAQLQKQTTFNLVKEFTFNLNKQVFHLKNSLIKVRLEFQPQ